MLKQKLKRKIQESAITGCSKQAANSESLSNLTPSERLHFGRTDSLKRNLNRIAAKGRPADPVSLEELEIVHPFNKTKDGRNFLIDDNTDTSTRIIVWGSDICIAHLAESDVWMMDGTFKITPPMFYQLYVIRAPLEDTSVSCVYAIMTGKSYETYRQLLTIVMEKCTDISGRDPYPSKIVIDFEAAMIKAVTDVFGYNGLVQACFFHLTKSTWRHIQKRASSRDMMRVSTRDSFVMNGLAFLPLDLVPEGMRFIDNNCPNHLQVLLN